MISEIQGLTSEIKSPNRPSDVALTDHLLQYEHGKAPPDRQDYTNTSRLELPLRSQLWTLLIPISRFLNTTLPTPESGLARGSQAAIKPAAPSRTQCKMTLSSETETPGMRPQPGLSKLKGCDTHGWNGLVRLTDSAGLCRTPVWGFFLFFLTSILSSQTDAVQGGGPCHQDVHQHLSSEPRRARTRQLQHCGNETRRTSSTVHLVPTAEGEHCG